MQKPLIYCWIGTLSILSLTACATNREAAETAEKISVATENAQKVTDAILVQHQKTYTALGNAAQASIIVRRNRTQAVNQLIEQLVHRCEADIEAAYGRAQADLNANFIAAFDDVQFSIATTVKPLKNLSEEREKSLDSAKKKLDERPSDFDARKAYTDAADRYILAHTNLLDLTNTTTVDAYDAMKAILVKGLNDLDAAKQTADTACLKFERDLRAEASKLRASPAATTLDTEFPQDLTKAYAALSDYYGAVKAFSDSQKTYHEALTFGPNGIVAEFKAGLSDAASAAVSQLIPPKVLNALRDPSRAVQNLSDKYTNQVIDIVNDLNEKADSLSKDTISKIETEITLASRTAANSVKNVVEKAVADISAEEDGK